MSSKWTVSAGVSAFIPAGAHEVDKSLHAIRAAASEHYRSLGVPMPPPRSQTLSLTYENFIHGPPLSPEHSTIRQFLAHLITAAETSTSRECVVTVLFCTMCEAYSTHANPDHTPDHWSLLLIGEITQYALLVLQAEVDTTRMWLAFQDRWSYPAMCLQMFRSRLLSITVLMEDLLLGDASAVVLPYLLAQPDFARCYTTQCIGVSSTVTA